MSRQQFLRTYMWSIVACGAAVMLFSLHRLPLTQLSVPFLLLALLAVVASSSFAVNIPRVTGRITVADTFIFLSMLLFGGETAVLLAAADGLCASLRISRKPRTILFNTAVMAASTFVTVWALRRLYGPIVGLAGADYSVNYLGALCVMGLTQYAVNSGLIALEKSIKTGRPLWATWRDFYLWTSVTYLAGASAAGLIARLVGAVGFYAVALAAPTVAVVYLTYRTYLKHIEASEGHAREVERHVVELSHYIEELKRTEEERDRLLVREQQARGEAEESVRVKDEFLATLSHELRTPLTSILGWANLLRTAQLDGATRAQAMEAIERSAQNQKRLIEDLFDVSRIITGKLRLDVRQIDLARVVEDAVEVVRPAADANGIRLVASCEPGAGAVMGDPGRLQQVVWNLLFNAVKFTPVGGRVEIRLAREGARASVSVSDTGQGIAPEFLPRVFDRFRQADGSTTRAHGGLGLGLSIVRHIVEAHGGQVRAESPGEGLGSTFTLTLPVLAVRGDAPEHGRGDYHPAREPASRIEGLRVLVVDDDDDARQMIGAVLTRFGAQVRPCGTAGEALEALLGWKPDVLLSDIGMPHEDGYDLIRRVRALSSMQGGQTPAAALTAYAREEDRVRSLAAGFQLHVAKPVGSEELIAAVASLARQAV
ncbi:MAG TPA: ATP-binding protein [Pyrinomonadaceae bacterium]|jgi:signal transduction histidine kinase/ActR/RegA family two-component response regulator|nr:ATP-binding protein [Pyrinomonadaceae bacterium]